MVVAVWPLVPVILPIALIVSGVSLLGRYRHRGQPFGTPAARKRALAVILATAVAATALAYLVTSLSPESLGMSIGVLVPPLLCVHRLQPEGEPQDSLDERPFWLQAATVGVAHLLDKLEHQMAVDRDDWCDLQLSKLKLDRRSPRRSLDELQDAATFLHSKLEGRRDAGRPLPARLETAYEALLSAAETARGTREARQQVIRAEKAFTDMLQFAYDWGHTDDGIMPNAAGLGTPPPPAEVAGAPQAPSRR
jgi:hypothetical protein